MRSRGKAEGPRKTDKPIQSLPNLSKTNKLIFHCLSCDKRMETVPSRPRKYCSYECREEHKRGGMAGLCAKFWSRVRKGEPDQCWLWLTGGVPETGYGLFSINGKRMGSHRFAKSLIEGRELKAEEFVCHTCDNPPCVNPAHLFLSTNKGNQEDLVKKGKSKKGEQINTAKLKEGDVQWIRMTYQRSKEEMKAKGKIRVAKGLVTKLAKKFGVHVGTIGKIVRGNHWKHCIPNDQPIK